MEGSKMIVYVVTYNVYTAYETDSTWVRGVFSSKSNAELYITKHNHEISEDTHHDAEYFEIIEQELDGDLE
jgi:hypothetical protein